MIATVGCESGTSGKIVGRSEELVAGGDSEVADCHLVAGRDAKTQSVRRLELLARGVRTDLIWKMQCELCNSR